eukprot:g1832.t1
MSLPIAEAGSRAGSRWLALAALYLAMFMNILDISVVNLALPAIQADLGASETELEWVLVVYVLSFAAGLLPFGRFGDVLGRSRLFCWGVAGFTLSSLACGLASDSLSLIVARGIQGLAGAMMVPQVLAIVHVLFSGDEKGKAMGLFGAVSALGAVAGPLVGGVLVSADLFGLSWRPIFLINLPIGLISIAGALRFLPEMKNNWRLAPDWTGTALFAFAILALVFPLVEGRQFGWPLWCFALIAVGGLLAGVFVWQQKRNFRQNRPQLLPVPLTRDPVFVGGVAFVALFFSAMAGMFFMLAVFLQSGLGLSPLMAGLVFAPHPVGVILASSLTGRLGARWLKGRIVLSSFIVLCGLIAFRTAVATEAPAIWFLAPLLTVGLGVGTGIPALFQLVLTRVHGDDAGAGSGVLQAFQQVGMALGIAVQGQIFFQVLDYHASVEHAYETKHIHLCSQNDIYIKRRGGDDYVQYWKSLTGEDFAVVELNGAIDACESLSQLLLGNPDALTQILERCTGQAIVVPFSPSKTERKVSDLLDMPLWGAPKAWETVGRKSSLLALAGGVGIPIPDSHRLDQSFDPNTLLGLCEGLKQQGYQSAIVKSDLGIAGRGHWKFSLVDFDRQAADSLVAQIRNAEEEGSHYVKSSFVLEGWVENAVSIGCYLDVLEDGAVHPVWYWQQLFAPSGTAYLGAQSLGLAEEVEADLLDILHSLGNALAERGFYGSFGPDFLWHEESGFRLLEVNARLPATAFAFHAADKIGRDDSNRGYVCIPKLSIGKVTSDVQEPGLRDILAFDRAEKNGAYVGEINVIQVSSFCGLNGAIWGYDVAASNWQANAPLLEVSQGDRTLPVNDLLPVIEAGSSLLGTAAKKRYRISPGSFVPAAVKLKMVSGPAIAWCALGIGIAKDRTTNADLFMETAGSVVEDDFEGLRHRIVRDMAKSVVECGWDTPFERVFVGVKAEFVEAEEHACALTMVPYLTLPASLEPNKDPAVLAGMSLEEFETHLLTLQAAQAA